MENKYEKWAMESLDEITDKLQTGVLFDGENEKLIKKILFEEQARMYNKSKKKQKCMCPNCHNESIIKSHTIPRKMSLDIIADNKKIITPFFIERYPISNQFIGVKEMGIGETSTFPGFCKAHEMIFQSYEKKGTISKEEDVIKQLYRNIAYNYFWFKERIELSEHIEDRYRKVRNQAAYNYLKELEPTNALKKVILEGNDKYIEKLIYHRTELNDFCTKLEKYRMSLWKIINGNDADITVNSVVIDMVFPVCICGCTEIVLDNQEYLCSVDVVSNKNNTLITIGVCGDISSELSNAVDTRLNHPLAILNFIEAVMIYGTDNWYLNPKVWNALSNQRKERLLSEMQNLGKSIFSELPYSIFDDIRKYIIENISLEKQNVERELSKMRI